MTKYNKIKIGMKIGLWTIIGKAEPIVDKDGKKNSAWMCKCDCTKQTIKSVRETTLKNGSSSSCGCTRSIRKDNTYNLTKEYGIGYTYKGEEFYFDLEDYDKIKDYSWRINKDGYVVASVTVEDNKRSVVGLHNVVMNISSKLNQIDHIYHNKNDNRKSQLRVVTNQQNGMNRKIQSNNTSGFTGVTFDKLKGKWKATIKINGKLKSLGYFSDKNDAILERINAEKIYFKEYRYVR